MSRNIHNTVKLEARNLKVFDKKYYLFQIIKRIHYYDERLLIANVANQIIHHERLLNYSEITEDVPNL